jgi:uncharacterized membrane protein YfcA
MDIIYRVLDLSLWQWAAIIISAFFIGFSKTGIGGVVMLAIPILASLFGGKDSTGIMLPMLLMGDIFAVCYYHRSTEWKNVIKPLPSALVGLAIGAIIGNYISDGVFKILIGVIVLLCLGILVYTERKGQNFVVPNDAWFYITAGILSGFASMIGNAAVPIFSIYLLALGFKKNNYMGTNAWFFLIINSIKIPLQVFIWNNIGIKSAVITVSMIPVITFGAVLGFLVLKKINDKYFRYIVVAMTAAAALRLFV